MPAWDKSELVKVGRDRAHALEGEVESRRAASDAAEERRDPAADASVDMHPGPRIERHAADLVDRIDHAMRVAGRRPHQRHGVVVDQFAHRLYIDALVRIQRRPPDVDVHHDGGLVEGGVSGDRHDDVGPPAGPSEFLGAVAFARRLHGEKDAFGAACREQSVGACGRGEQIEPVVDDIALHLAEAGIGAAVAQRIERKIFEEGLFPDLVGLFVRHEEKDRGAAAMPVGVLARPFAHLRGERVPVQAALRKGGAASFGHDGFP